jgi:hypothetical protein
LGEARRVLADLNRDGIAITSARALLGPDSVYDALAAAVTGLECDMAETLAAARAEAEHLDAIGQKSFMAALLGDLPVLDPGLVYARFALQEPILQIANAYFGMLTQLRYYNVWHTFATRGEPRESQLWHRDREDRQILKVFVHLSDVDDGAGPFTYAPATHMKGRMCREPRHFLEGSVRRSDDTQMAEVVRPEQWVKAVGPRGTLVFADTRGYHKGGLAREQDRILYTCMFTSAASQVREWFERPRAIALPASGPGAARGGAATGPGATSQTPSEGVGSEGKVVG